MTEKSAIVILRYITLSYAILGMFNYLWFNMNYSSINLI